MARPKIAAIVTEYRRNAHAQHIVDRFLWGYGWQGQHHHPPMDDHRRSHLRWTSHHWTIAWTGFIGQLHRLEWPPLVSGTASRTGGL